MWCFFFFPNNKTISNLKIITFSYADGKFGLPIKNFGSGQAELSGLEPLSSTAEVLMVWGWNWTGPLSIFSDS
jgi:hypothetical protein